MSSVAYRRVKQYVKAAELSTDEEKTQYLLQRAEEEIRAALESNKFNMEEIPEMQQHLREKGK